MEELPCHYLVTIQALYIILPRPRLVRCRDRVQQLTSLDPWLNVRNTFILDSWPFKYLEHKDDLHILPWQQQSIILFMSDRPQNANGVTVIRKWPSSGSSSPKFLQFRTFDPSRIWRTVAWATSRGRKLSRRASRRSRPTTPGSGSWSGGSFQRDLKNT